MGSRIVMKGTKVGNLYFLQGSIVTGGAIMKSSVVKRNSPFVYCKGVTNERSYVKTGYLNSRSSYGRATQHYGMATKIAVVLTGRQTREDRRGVSLR